MIRLVRPRACPPSDEPVSHSPARVSPSPTHHNQPILNPVLTRSCPSRSIPQFLTGARYSATDGLFPHWSAAYDIASVGLFSNPVYTVLRANRSPREANLVARLGVLDRRTAQTIEASAPAPAPKDAAKFVLTIADDNEVPVKGFEGVAGWRRSHGHRVYDSLVTGHGKEPVPNKHLPFVAVHGTPPRPTLSIKHRGQRLTRHFLLLMLSRV